MSKSWLMCVLLGSLAWGQATLRQATLGQAQPATPAATPSGAAPAAGASQAQAPAAPAQPAQAPAAGNAASSPAVSAPAAAPTAEVAPTAPVLTIKGVCPVTAPKAKTTTPGTKSPAAAKDPAKTSAATTSANCETVITRAEFEKLASGIAPNMTPQLKRQLASVYPRLLVMSQAAEKRGLQNSPQYKETMKFARMQILTNELQRSVQEDAAKVPEQDIADYYKKNPEAFQEYTLNRLYIPRMKQVSEDAEAKEPNAGEKDTKETEEQQKAKQEQEKAKQEQGEQEMSKLAESLHARAAAGEDFAKLQKEAFDASGMKIESPTVTMPKIRRTGLPPAHAAVFDLKPGEVSAVLSDTGGHYVYKVISEEQLPQEQVKQEIHTTLQTQRMRDAMDKFQNSFKTETNEAYFGPASPAGARQPLPRMPRPTAPGAQGQPQPQPPQAPAQQPPAAQPPPGSKPN